MARVDSGRVVLDLDGDGRSETFHECASTEGVHYTVRSGSGVQKWWRYVYLGYDLEPTCTDGDSLQ